MGVRHEHRAIPAERGFLRHVPGDRGALSRVGMLLWSVVHGVRAQQLDYRAMSLVYTSLLAFVPLLAVSFSVFKAFGVHTQLEPALLQLLEPLGDNAAEVTRAIVSSVQQLQVGVLGFVGFLFLFYATVSMLGKIEESFNHIWRTRVSRNFLRRLGDYLSFMLGGPLILFLAFGGMTGRGLSRALASAWWPTAGAVLPYIFIIAVFTFLYRYIPNTRVAPAAALFGGVIGGLLWKFAGWCFARFVADSTQYHAVYSSFTIPVLFIVWLYMSWLIVLIGVQFSFYFQYPQSIGAPAYPLRSEHRRVELGAVDLMYRVARRHHDAGGVMSFEELSRHTPLSVAGLRAVLDGLESAGLLVAIGDEREAFMPGRDIATIRPADIVAAMRGPAATGADVAPAVGALMSDAESAFYDRLAGASLAELVDDGSFESTGAGVPNA